MEMPYSPYEFVFVRKLGYKNQKEGIKGDHFVGQYYVRYAREADKEQNLENVLGKSFFR